MSSNEANNLARLGDVPHSDNILVTLVKQIASKLALLSVETIHPAKIISVRGKIVTINRGESYGFKVGNKLDVFGIDEVVDDETGEIYKSEIPLGSIIVNRVTPDLTYALIGDDNLGISKIVQFIFLKTNQLLLRKLFLKLLNVHINQQQVVLAKHH